MLILLRKNLFLMLRARRLKKETKMIKLVLLRNGESVWIEENRCAAKDNVVNRILNVGI